MADGVAGKTILITGTARGCGRVLAEAFAAEGASVVGCDVDVDRGREVADRVRSGGGRMTFVEADVTDEDAVRAVLAHVADTHGRLDGAVNNAGTETTGLIADADGDVVDRLLAVNVKGVLHSLKHELAALKAAGGGAIVNMSSVTSDMTAVPANGVYAATKGAVDALTKAAAVEAAADGISVNALAFAAVDIPDDMFWRFLDDRGIPVETIVAAFPVKRLARPAELVAAVRYLLSDDARFVTGTTLVLDGGYTAQ
ncbi:SDR family NAD(P)-dependent oxidoreductase [Pseudonocardia pini]|uniref:SDR family NAD(P)-dependent oxidoreductase n=1 Tax=Pseudonocardia pini TaxID=2758030 RepID=UPI0015F088C1|nr:SDR family oxidoreductase [Pseudonocardia pini]